MTEPAKPDVSENLSHGHLVAYLILALVALLAMLDVQILCTGL